MRQKNPRFEFLNINPNPTLGTLLTQFESEKNSNQSNPSLSDLVEDLKQELAKLSLPNGVVNLIEQLQQQLKEKDFFEARDKIKNGLKRIKLIKNNDEIQEKIRVLYNQVLKEIDLEFETTPHENALFLLSDLIYLNESIYTPLSDIKNELSSEAFTLYITFQTVGCVNGDGWTFGIFGNMPQLVPYLPDEFEKLGYKKVPEAIRNTINVFPENTNFLFDNEEYIDVLNFMENSRRKVDNPKLKKYTKKEREQFCSNYHNSLKQIENIEDEIWSGTNEWKGIIRYYNDNLEKRIWKKTTLIN